MNRIAKKCGGVRGLAALAVLAVLAVLALGCSPVERAAPGAVVLVLTTDAPASGSTLAFDRVKVVVDDPRSNAPHVRQFALRASDMPETLTIAARPGSEQSGVVTRIQVFAFEGESNLRVYRAARLVLPPSGLEMVRMPLNVACDRVYPAGVCPPDERCASVPSKVCSVSETCVNGGCEAVDVPEGRLPTYTAGAEAPCIGEAVLLRCAAAGRACGSLTSADRCGEVHTVDCGPCGDAGGSDAGPRDSGADAGASDAGSVAVDAAPTCAAGTYSSGAACVGCPSGTFSNTVNAPACASWKDCVAGEYVSNAPSVSTDRGCAACLSGTFSVARNAAECAAWTVCQPGSFRASGGSSARDATCTPCGPGTYSDMANAGTCAACGAGTMPAPGATACVRIEGELGATTASMSGDGVDNCGVTANDVCARSLRIPGGTFHRGAGTSDPATVSEFRLDKYEITVGRFRKFVDGWVAGWRPGAGAGKHVHLNAGSGLVNTAGGHEAGWGAAWTSYLGAASSGAVTPSGAGAASKGDWDARLNCNANYATWTPSAGANERRPMNCASWYDLYAFCIWDGGFLPSEAEWEFAAAGGTDERTYPWGATPPGANASLAIVGCYYNGTGTCSGLTNIAPVGAVPAGASKTGQLDLAGNMWEWTLDSRQAAYTTPCDNCTTIAGGSYRVLRGGAFYYDATYAPADIRFNGFAAYRNYVNGGRCARIP